MNAAAISTISNSFDCSMDLFPIAAVAVCVGMALTAFLSTCCGKAGGPKPGGDSSVSSVTYSNSVTVTRAGTTTRKNYATIRFRKE